MRPPPLPLPWLPSLLLVDEFELLLPLLRRSLRWVRVGVDAAEDDALLLRDPGGVFSSKPLLQKLPLPLPLPLSSSSSTSSAAPALLLLEGPWS